MLVHRVHLRGQLAHLRGERGQRLGKPIDHLYLPISRLCSAAKRVRQAIEVLLGLGGHVQRRVG